MCSFSAEEAFCEGWLGGLDLRTGPSPTWSNWQPKHSTSGVAVVRRVSLGGYDRMKIISDNGFRRSVVTGQNWHIRLRRLEEGEDQNRECNT